MAKKVSRPKYKQLYFQEQSMRKAVESKLNFWEGQIRPLLAREGESLQARLDHEIGSSYLLAPLQWWFFYFSVQANLRLSMYDDSIGYTGFQELNYNGKPVRMENYLRR